LVDVSSIRAREVYKRFNDADQKAAYRGDLLGVLRRAWEEAFGPEKAAGLIEKFMAFAENLDEKGAVVLGAILSTENFQSLIDEYTRILRESGSKSWIHTYVNLANHPEFLTNPEFNAAFLHPLLVALVSYRIGGPVRIVDARGKDAEPISILAQDNMLHIDNTPFNDEYKVILLWLRNQVSGPKGQNFVILPGTHKGARQCMIGERGPWSSENASIFTTREDIEQVFRFQESVLGKRAVVELTHETKPLTTLFAAGSLVHHRYRTEEGSPRSCMILAFHRAADNEGELIESGHLGKTAARTDDLSQLLLGQHGAGSEAVFLRALAEKSEMIADLFEAIDRGTTEEVKTEDRVLHDTESWISASTDAPTVEEKKAAEGISFPLGEEISLDDFIGIVIRHMLFDKHGPLDLILYPDAHEEIRKWARNQIREKNPALLAEQMNSTWKESLVQPSEASLLSPVQLKEIAEALAVEAQRRLDRGVGEAVFSEGEKISPTNAYRSIKQLLIDLGESITRCEDRTAFLSTSLFLFWTADSLMRLEKEHDPAIKAIGEQLLANYVSTGILVDQQIRAKSVSSSSFHRE
jgi:hypothetical protein